MVCIGGQSIVASRSYITLGSHVPGMESELDLVRFIRTLCPRDFHTLPGHHGWLHWFNFPIPDGGRPNLDLWPDVSSYSPSELFPAPGLKFENGEQPFLFSSRHPKTVHRLASYFYS